MSLEQEFGSCKGGEHFAGEDTEVAQEWGCLRARKGHWSRAEPGVMGGRPGYRALES